MNYELVIVFKYSIVLALITGLVRYGKISRTYRPFIYIIIAGFLGELIASLSTLFYHNNILVSNVYSLVECILWIWQFRRWNVSHNKRNVMLLLTGLIAFWTIETAIGGRTNFNSAFSVLYSFTLVFFAINQINQLIVEEKMNLLKNAKFLICTGVIIFYTYSVLVDSFYVLKVKESNSFLASIYYILVYVNLFVNLLYALATLWIPTRERFTLPS
ncbi:MAG: hypothetical protein H0X41_12975 [Chitinophagaceae bacterium]|nr:hypothetical protein [Chitinophagaceae bacterium]